MNKTKHLFLKLLVLLMFGVGWSVSAWAERVMPTIETSYSKEGHWHYLRFSHHTRYAKSNGVGNVITIPQSKATDGTCWWQFVGTSSDFVIVDYSGNYITWANPYKVTSDVNQAAHFELDEHTGDANAWELINKGLTGQVWMNPRISNNNIQHWNDNDNGNKLIFDAVTDLEIWELSYTGPRWYTMKPNNGGYISSDYASSGRMHVNNGNAKPTNYAGIWQFYDVPGVAGQNLINAKFFDTRVLSVVGTDGTASSMMDPVSSVRSSSRYKFEIASNGFVQVQGENLYLGNNSMWLCVRNTTNDGSLNLNLTRVPNMGNNVSIVINGAGSITYNTQCEALSGETNVTLTNGVTHDFKNMPYLSSLFAAKEADKVLSAIEFDEISQTLTFTLVQNNLPTIVHRRAYFYDKYDAVAEANRPRNESYVGRDGNGWMKNENTNDNIQKTSEYRIPVYLEPSSSRQMYMPTDKLAYYQRWYDYSTEGQVNQGVMPALYQQNFKAYTNGHVSGSIGLGIGWQQNPTFTLPTYLPKDINGFYKDYIVGVDVSRYKDRTIDNGTGNLTEPTLSQRILFEIKDANRIATDLTACTGNKWLEERSIIFPTIKRGTSNRKTHQDVLPLNMDLCNYWVYSASNQLVQLTARNQIEVVVEGNAGITASLIGDSNDGGLQGVNFNQGHFIRFEYPGTETVRQVPDNSHATVKVYFKEGTKKYQLAKFELTFAPGTDPRIITEIIGKDGDQYKSERSPYSLKEKYGNPVAELTFENKNILMKDNLPISNFVDNTGGTTNDIGTYLFPLDFNLTNYAYGFEKGDGTARGEYTIANARHLPAKASLRFKPVQHYYDVLNGTTNERSDDQFYIYVDASDQPGEVMSLTIRDNLCAGTRLYVNGWMATTSYTSNPSSILLNLVGTNTKTKASKIITSYCPGMIHSYVYDKDGNEVLSMNNTTGVPAANDQTASHWGMWSQIAFSFLLTSADVHDYDQFQLQVVNNCFNSSGGDYLLDNFQIFANPPKGEVDFTTPLCSDKVRHAKIHTDFDMLKDLSNVNETDPNAKLFATFCFLDAEIFDNFEEGSLKISEMFEKDDKGNHNLKPGYDEKNIAVQNIINHAFRQALVGSRYIKSSGKNDYGFHSFEIPVNFGSIPAYSYIDSKEDVVYSEIDGQVRRLVFKENVVRGEMQMVPQVDEHHPAYWPYMRPSRTYYLVFSPIGITAQVQIDSEDTATKIFGIQDDCSFFGKFKTKDPMHVILDNADIESDLPVEAVCHGDEVTLSFNMPVLKAGKPIYDEEYCISDQALDDKMVPESQGVHHYRYEAKLKNDEVTGVITNLQYDIWMGGLQKGTGTDTYRGTFKDYMEAVHPTKTYSHDTADPSHTHTHPEEYKKDGEHVNISQAMRDFRFFYPNFKEGDNWNEVTTHDYNNDSGYSFLNSEKEAIMDLVDRGIIVLRQNNFSMSKNFDNGEELTDEEKNDLMEKQMNDQILELARKLSPTDDAPLPLKDLEGTVLSKLSNDGKIRLTFEEYGNFTKEDLKGIADKLQTAGHLTPATCAQLKAMSESDLRKNLESVLRGLSVNDLLNFAPTGFPNIGHEKRAYLVVRALNILSREVVANLTNPTSVQIRTALRNTMISIFKEQKVAVLKKMWSDVSAKLTESERAHLLEGDKDPNTMNADALAELVEDGLAQLTNNVLARLNKDRYVHFTLVPIMPSQENFVDQPYIFCPEPRGVKVTLRNAAPKMLNGFGDKTYPTDMNNVPVRAGVQQLNAVSRDISSTIPADAKTLRIPLRGLVRALDEGVNLVPYEQTLGENPKPIKTVFLVDTNDSVYEKELDKESEQEEEMKLEAWGKVTKMQAEFGRTDNYMELVFNEKYPMHEGHTYRIGVRFVEQEAYIEDNTEKKRRDIACDGIFYFDLKVVPEYQVWTGKASKNTEWTNDHNWARADRSELLADGTKTSDVISQSTKFADGDTYPEGTTAAANYPTNLGNFGKDRNAHSYGFMPMYFTNALFNDSNVVAPNMVKADVKDGFLAFTNGSEKVTPDASSNRSGFENHTMIDHKLPKSVAFVKNADSLALLKTIYSIAYDMVVAPVGTEGTSTTAPIAADLENRYTTAFSGQNYMCEPFFTNVAKGVTFAPQTQLVNAHYLNYYKAWVEYELDVNRWYTLGSPLQNTFAGEWYAPTDGAKQLSPYFYGIEYVQRNGTSASATGYNDRFRPAIYQRSWDSNGKVHVYKQDGNEATWGTNQEPAYVKADWSYVYNDVLKEYSEGGFSVKVNTDLMTNKPSDNKATIRMPKADTEYTYYDSETHTGQQENGAIPSTATNRGRLWSDKFTENVTEFSQTITNRSNGNNGTVVNNFFLVNNPFIANMNMDKFFTENPQFEKKYWIMTADRQIVKVNADRTTWVTANGSDFATTVSADAKVGPLQGFFVKTTASTNTTTVKFTADMQATTTASKAEELKSRPEAASSIQTLSLTAQRGDFTSTAVVAISNGASKEYVSSEDCETFIDSDMADLPTIYTVASGQAMTVNTLSAIDMIAVGIIGKEGEEVDVTISGNCEGLLLFDSKENTYTEIQDGTTLQMACGVSGRYFITASTTALDQITDNDRIRKGVWSVNGMYCGDTTDGLAPGLYIVDGVKMNIR